jgi:hypothetical protein
LHVQDRGELLMLLFDIHFKWWLREGPPPGCPRKMGRQGHSPKGIALE